MTTLVTITPRALLGTAAAVLLALGFSVSAANAASVRSQQLQRLQLDLRAGDSRPVAVDDEHCGGIWIPCDNKAFLNYCAKHGGTLSGPQGWGGRTCHMPS